MSRNLSKQQFSTGSGRLTLKNCLRDYFHLLKSTEFKFRFLDVLVLICGFLLYYLLNTGMSRSIFGKLKT